jgi:FkbM family methyltransferase
MDKKIFIDCGFYAGYAISHFEKTAEYSPDFTYYGFDPMLQEKTRKKWDNVTNVILDNKALWIFNGEIDFYTSGRVGGKANGAFHNKRAGSKENNLKVKCIDFSEWLGNNFDKNDFIVVKMDVEGAEYELLPKMIKDGTIDLIDIIYLEWHASRVGDEKNLKRFEIEKELNKKNVVIRQSIEWYLASYLKSLKTKGE